MALRRTALISANVPSSGSSTGAFSANRCTAASHSSSVCVAAECSAAGTCVATGLVRWFRAASAFFTTAAAICASRWSHRRCFRSACSRSSAITCRTTTRKHLGTFFTSLAQLLQRGLHALQPLRLPPAASVAEQRPSGHHSSSPSAA
ncbi:hypothetical protein PF003_g34740 [Phytophthora fragariae]|nr:hypothetical protein PF003_g34740 [Phytophthora fragariae]